MKTEKEKYPLSWDLIFRIRVIFLFIVVASLGIGIMLIVSFKNIFYGIILLIIALFFSILWFFGQQILRRIRI